MASTPTEVEIKFRITDLNAIKRKLRDSGFRLKTKRTHEMNVLYDAADGSIRQRGEVLRIRKYGKTWTLTHKSKGQVGKHKTRQELETQVADGEQLTQMFAALGYWEAFRYEKFRTEWTDGRGDVVVDETPIGNFGEIEGKPEWIDRSARKLGISETDYINKSYAQLFFEWKNATGANCEEMTFQSLRGSSSRST